MRCNIEIYDDIMDKLEFEPMINAMNIGVAVQEGVVTLTGTVSSYLERRSIERAINSIKGVRALANEIKVEIREDFNKMDTEIAKAAANVLQWHSEVPDDRIKVTVEKGRVTLTGEVNWWYHRKKAEDAVKSLIGVTDVNNHIIIKPLASKVDIKEQIIQEFQRNSGIHSKRIHIEASDSKVILKGQVSSWLEKQEAQRTAWSVPGVSTVENQLEIS